MELLRNIDPVWLSLGPIVVINIILTISLLYFLATRKGRPVPREVQTRHSSRFLSATLKHWWYWNTEPIAKFFIRIQATPNVLTFAGFLFSIAAAFFFAKGLYGYAGWIMLFGSSFDLFDGQVARLTGKTSRSGAFFDSVMDRFSEGILFLGLAFCFKDSWILGFIIAGLVGSMVVSYTRARGEAIGVDVKKGSMQRPERIVYLGCASIFEPITSYALGFWISNPPPYLVMAAIILIGVMTNVTAIYRMIFVMNALDSAEKKSVEPSVPQKLARLIDTQNRYGYDRSQSAFKLVLLLLVDGAHPDVLARLVREGKLPHIAKRFGEGGTTTEAITCFPSASGPAYTPFVTGCFPGTCNIPGIRWFDRTLPRERRLTTKRFRDYFGLGAYLFDFDLSKQVRTVYEYSRQAYNILGMANRGCGLVRDPAFLSAPYLFYKAKKQDNIEVVEATALRWFQQGLKRRPDFIFYFFPTIDLLSHETDREHPKVIAAYQRLDRAVGEMEKMLAAEGLSEETVWILASDHGHAKVKRHFDLEGFLEKRFRTLYFPKSFSGWERAEALTMPTGNGMSHLYFRRGEDWLSRPVFEELSANGIITALLDQKEIDVVIGREEAGTLRVVSARGEAQIRELEGEKLCYRVSGADPFGYPVLPEILTEQEMLQRTAATSYPDAPLQIAQLFRSPRCGDLVLSAAPGYDLRSRHETPEHQSGHGSLHREHMRVPLYFSPRVDLLPPPYRTVDIGATILHWMGVEPAHCLDGKTMLANSTPLSATAQYRQACR